MGPLQKSFRPPIEESGGIHLPELRQNFFTKEWVIIATERAKRPEDLATHRVLQPIPEFVESCPSCRLVLATKARRRPRCYRIRRIASRG
jgi:galactose-1-phosphate uridylyltransferase